METAPTADSLIQALAVSHRVLMLGGMAIIAHGFDRKTKDVDIWLEPQASPDAWAQALLAGSSGFPTARFWSLSKRGDVSADEIVAVVVRDGVIRITGFDREIDVFRHPNELEIEDFERVWLDASRELEGGVRLPNEIDLYRTKVNTGRSRDWSDQVFLEGKIKARFQERLQACDLAEAASMLDRFLDPEILRYAQCNPSKEVRELCLRYLREFEAEGDPYSRDILAGWKEPD